MSGHEGLGFGGFLVGLGTGWMVFQEIQVFCARARTCVC